MMARLKSSKRKKKRLLRLLPIKTKKMVRLQEALFSNRIKMTKTRNKHLIMRKSL